LSQRLKFPSLLINIPSQQRRIEIPSLKCIFFYNNIFASIFSLFSAKTMFKILLHLTLTLKNVNNILIPIKLGEGTKYTHKNKTSPHNIKILKVTKLKIIINPPSSYQDKFTINPLGSYKHKVV
jgi:hypothetical protein